MEIRPPNKLNYPAVADLVSEALGQSWDAEGLAGLIMADPLFDPNLVLMAREKGELLGFLSAVLDGETAWIKLVAVASGARRKGLGRELVERSEERLFGEGARILRVGFSPPSIFFPGAPEGAADFFFKSLGFQAQEGGLCAEISAAAAALKPGVSASATAAKKLMQSVAPAWWPDIEERLTFAVPRLNMSADGRALCVADPGLGIGPLFFEGASDASVSEAVLGALSLGGPRLKDSRNPQWWQQRFKLERVSRCFEFQKDLRGVFHA
jgi:GNAT superfamily N-acetyltransferase